MRYFEIVLKLLFLAGSVFFIVTHDIASLWFGAYMIIGAALGIVLIFNKDSSYRYPHTANTFLMRRIEGALLLAFPAIIYFIS
jgi:hypothetical protein